MKAVMPVAGRPAPPLGAPCRCHVPAEQQMDQTAQRATEAHATEKSCDGGLSTRCLPKDLRATRRLVAPPRGVCREKLWRSAQAVLPIWLPMNQQPLLERVPRV